MYLVGVPGLEDAANEIRSLKKTLHIRDREIEELTHYINEKNVRVNEYSYSTI